MLSKSDFREIDLVLSKRIRQELDPVKKDIVQIRKDLKTIISFFDKRLEHHSNLLSLS